MPAQTEQTDMQSRIDDLEQRIAQLEDHIKNLKASGGATEGPTQASSAALHNYPQTPPQVHEEAKKKDVGGQPLSGAAMTAEQKAR
jgi:hypothetical protein